MWVSHDGDYYGNVPYDMTVRNIPKNLTIFTRLHGVTFHMTNNSNRFTCSSVSWCVTSSFDGYLQGVTGH